MRIRHKHVVDALRLSTLDNIQWTVGRVSGAHPPLTPGLEEKAR